MASASSEEGVWVSYSYDMGPIDVRPHKDELAARRAADDDMPGYGHVVFVLFGQDIREAEMRARELKD
jgi:hypothetical protein